MPCVIGSKNNIAADANDEHSLNPFFKYVKLYYMKILKMFCDFMILKLKD